MNIIKVSNGYGSAHIPETDEVSHNIVISVSHYDDTPDYKVFTVGPFIFPKVIEKIDSGRSVIIIIEAGLAKNRKKYSVVVSETDLKIQH